MATKAILFSPFAFKTGKTFTSIKEALEASRDTLDPEAKKTYQAIIDNLPDFMLKRKRRDTSFGGNEAINCYPQFHEDDDIVHPLNQVDASGNGLGRVYSETFDDRQRVMYMTFGVPRFTSLLSFFTEAIDSNIASLMNTGEFSGIKKIASMIGTVSGTLIALPLIPLIWVKRVVDAIAFPVTRFYDLKSSMPLYYRLVNSIVAHLSVNMNLSAMDGDAFDISKETVDTGNGTERPITKEQYKATESKEQTKTESYEFEILHLLSQKELWDGLISDKERKTVDQHIEQLIKQKENDPKGFFDSFVSGFISGVSDFGSGFKAGASRSFQFVGVKVEKSTDSSESISNTAGESELAGQLNSTVSAARNKVFSLAQGNITEAVGTGLDAIKTMLGSAMSSMGMDGLQNGLRVFAGSGYLDIPEFYQGSSFSKSYSFRMNLRATYGNPLSILYDVYLPFAMMMVASFPRATGPNSYTSPFLVRAYSQGQFAIPMGLIDSLSITRGSQEFGWNYGGLPLSVDLNFTIKDLSPIMFIAPSTSFLKSMFGNNTSFQEYMLTLSGVGLEDRVLWLNRLEKRWKTSATMFYNNYVNPMMWGFRFGSTNLAQFPTHFGYSHLPK